MVPVSMLWWANSWVRYGILIRPAGRVPVSWLRNTRMCCSRGRKVDLFWHVHDERMVWWVS